MLRGSGQHPVVISPQDLGRFMFQDIHGDDADDEDEEEDEDGAFDYGMGVRLDLILGTLLKHTQLMKL